MAGPKGINSQLTAELAGITRAGDYTTPVGDANKVQALLDLIEPEETSVYRGYMDQMSPTARLQLIVELRALKAAVT